MQNEFPKTVSYNQSPKSKKHARHRSFDNLITNLLSRLITYTFFAKKRSINVNFENNRHAI